MWSPAHPLPQGVRLQCTGGTDRTIQVLGPNRTSSGPGSLPGAGRLESFFRRWREPVLDLGLERLLYAVSVPGQVLQGRIGAAMQLGPDVWVAQLPEPSNPVRLRRCSVGPVMEPLHDPYVFYEGLVRGWVRRSSSSWTRVLYPGGRILFRNYRRKFPQVRNGATMRRQRAAML